ncbi:uncharacterized protein LOC128210241 [Mya arenaria]|uniref:uncharacterized protein LOC128210241 n=1 Tax=Mya arenaria TaxID=6604 RepID=UPI0022E24121|nr:uncharacterized protein LOC128210241 [Mya arenaria]
MRYSTRIANILQGEIQNLKEKLVNKDRQIADMQANQNRMYAENDSLMLRVKMAEQTAARARASLPKESRVAAKKQLLQETVTQANNARFDKVAVVEYTNQSVYIGEMEGNMMTFARRPVGKLTVLST